MKIAIVAITEGGAVLGRKIARALPEAELHLPERLARGGGSHSFAGPVGDLLEPLFNEGWALVCIMATGIVVRLLAPHLRGKDLDPPVVVMDEAGSFAISLLSGHLGGANDLARDLARIAGGQAVITTATDVNGLPAWDEEARKAGLGIEPVGHVKHLNGLLLRGAAIALVDRRRRIAPRFVGVPGVRLAATFAAALRMKVEGRVFVTHRFIPQLERQPELLVLRPRDLVVGIGCNRGTSAEEIEAVVRDELKHAFLAFGSVASLATISAKADETGLCEFSRRHQLPLECHSAAALNAVTAPGAPSLHALAAVGAKGVCEPAALLSAGAASLLVRKKKNGNVTVAVAEKSGGGCAVFGTVSTPGCGRR